MKALLTNSFMKRPLTAALLALVLAATGCADPFQRAADYASLADSQLSAGSLDEARENIQRAILARDDVAEYYVLLGRIELQAQRPSSAFNAYSMALDLQADNAEVLQNIAELGLQTGRIREAQDAADRILLLSPGSARAMLVKGFIAIDSGRLDDAREMASKILAANSSDEGGIILLARVDALQGKGADALAAIKAASVDLGSTKALNVTLLEIYRMQGNSKGMLDLFPDILKSMNGDLNYQLDFINLLYKSGNRPAARAQAVKAIQAAPNEANLFKALSALWLEYDRTPLSASQIEYIAESGTRATQLSLARFYYVTGDYRVARRLSSRPFEGQTPEAQGLMARIMLAQGERGRAVDLARRLLLLDSRNEDALLVTSAENLAAGRIDRAIEDANVVTSDSPEDYAGYVALADAYVAKGSLIRARQTYERGMDFLPQSMMLADAYRTFLLRSNDTARIVSLYQDLSMAKPSSVPAWTEYARLCQTYGDALCAAKATTGMARAKASFTVDDPPGTPLRRGMFARIAPNKICTAPGGVCTES